MNEEQEKHFAISAGKGRIIIIPKNFIFGINFIICIVGYGIFVKFYPDYVKGINDIAINPTIKNILILTPALVILFLLAIIGSYLITVIIMIIKGKIKHSDL